jgi:hypothetical protein
MEGEAVKGIGWRGEEEGRGSIQGNWEDFWRSGWLQPLFFKNH